MNRFSILFVVVGTLFLFACKSKESVEKKPNIILFYTDDNAFEYWGFGGGPDLSPNIDKIAEQGVMATQFYSTASVCTPARFSIHTGLYPGRCKHPEFLKDNPVDQPYQITWNTSLQTEKDNILGKLMQSGGYKTAFVGKWHLGGVGPAELGYNFDTDADPKDPKVDSLLKAYQADVIDHVKTAGFDYAASITPYNNDWHPVQAVNYHNLEWYAKGAIDFLNESGSSDQPFILLINITTHHGPCHIESINADIGITQAGYVDGLEGIMPPRKTIFERIEAKGLEADFKTAGSVWTDDLVKTIMDRCDELNISSKTAFVFTTDHNRYDGKGTVYQGGVHIPFVMRYDNVIPAGSVMDERFEMVDLLPTFLEMGGIEQPQDIDGISVWQNLTGKTNEAIKDEIYLEFGYSRGIIVGDYKYVALRFPDSLLTNMKTEVVEKAYTVKGKTGDEPTVLRYPHYFEPEQLYNISTDYQEQINLAGDPEYNDILIELKTKLKQQLQTFQHPFPIDEIDPFYYSDQYKLLTDRAREIDMNQYYWYRKGCY